MNNNDKIVHRIKGMPATPSTPETEADPRNPNTGSASCRPPQEVEAENVALREAILAYLSEFDNPVPDALYRKTLRDRLRKLVGAPPQQLRGGRS